MNEILRRLQALPEDKKARVVDLMNRYDPTSPGVIEFVSRENLHDRAYRANPSPIRVVRYAKYEAALARIEALEKELKTAKAALAAAPEAKP